jgi:hypothetical protein
MRSRPGSRSAWPLPAVRERDRRLAGRPRAEVPQGGREAKKAGHAYVVVDGTLIPIDRVAADRPFYSGSTRSTA